MASGEGRISRLVKAGYSHTNRSTREGAERCARKLRAKGYRVVIMPDHVSTTRGRGFMIYEIWYKEK